MKGFDIYLNERRKEYDVLVKERLTEWDILIESLQYREFFTAEDCLLLDSCVERYRLMKLTGGSTDTVLDTRIEKALKRCYTQLLSQLETSQELSRLNKTTFTSLANELQPAEEAIALTAHLFGVAASDVSPGAELLDIDAHTRFDGVELVMIPGAAITDSARKYLQLESDALPGAELSDTMHIFAEPDGPSMEMDAEVLGSMLIKLRRVSELDGNALSALDGKTLSELDYTILDD